LIEELLTYARLDRPQNELQLSTPDLPGWIRSYVDDVQSVTPERMLSLSQVTAGDYGALDMRLMERVLDNLGEYSVSSISRHVLL
jgi:two-component system sensor histidine kinase RstB